MTISEEEWKYYRRHSTTIEGYEAGYLRGGGVWVEGRGRMTEKEAREFLKIDNSVSFTKG